MCFMFSKCSILHSNWLSEIVGYQNKGSCNMSEVQSHLKRSGLDVSMVRKSTSSSEICFFLLSMY